MRVRPAEKSNSKGPRRAEAKSRNERNGRGGWGALPTAWTLRDVGTEEDSQDGMVGSGVCPVGNSAWCGEDGARPAVQVHSSRRGGEASHSGRTGGAADRLTSRSRGGVREKDKRQGRYHDLWPGRLNGCHTRMGKAGGQEALRAGWEFGFGHADLDSKWSCLAGSCRSQELQGQVQLGISVWEPSITDPRASRPTSPQAFQVP